MFRCPLAKQLVQIDVNADVHYGTIKSLAYFKNELGLLGIGDGSAISGYSSVHLIVSINDGIDVHNISGILNKEFVKSVCAKETPSGKSERLSLFIT